MRKILIFLILVSFLVFPIVSFTQPPGAPSPPPPGVGPGPVPLPGVIERPEDLLRIIERITNWIFTFLLVTATICLIIAGFYFVTAGGNPDKISQAHRMVIYALVGVAVAVLSKGVVWVIRGIIVG